MISDVLAHATTELRGYLNSLDLQEVYSGALRQRLEWLIAEMDAIRVLPV
jgi:hypothetical protein